MVSPSPTALCSWRGPGEINCTGRQAGYTGPLSGPNFGGFRPVALGFGRRFVVIRGVVQAVGPVQGLHRSRLLPSLFKDPPTSAP